MTSPRRTTILTPMEGWLELRLKLLVVPVLIGGAVFAAILVALRWLIPDDRTHLKRRVALCWLVGLSAALWIGFELEDAKAAAIHNRNIGIPVVFIWAWVTMVLPAPFVGMAMLSLGGDWLGTLGNHRDE